MCVTCSRTRRLSGMVSVLSRPLSMTVVRVGAVRADFSPKSRKVGSVRVGSPQVTDGHSELSWGSGGHRTA